MIQKHMDKCPICSYRVNYSYNVIFRDLIGISSMYKEEICVCEECQHIFASNPISNDILQRYYKQLSKYEGDKSLGKVNVSKIKMSKRQFHFINNLNIKFKTVLDIGASTGFGLNTFKLNGYDVYGIEPSNNNKKFAKLNYNIDMFAGTFEDYLKEDICGQFDLVIMSHVLEHIGNPVEFLRKVANINSKYLFIEVPIFDYILEGEPFGMFFYEHVGYFTIKSLSYLMKKVGYKAININMEFNLNGESPNYPTLVSLWEKGEGKIIKGVYNSIFLFNQYINVSISKFKKIKEIIDSIKSKKIAIWGTGSHTSRLLGMTNLKDKNIIKFYDSDPKKYNFKMLGKDITAFNINDIKTGIIDTILISTFAGEKFIKNYLDNLNLDVNITRCAMSCIQKY